MNLGAIDIGSNAARLLISNVSPDKEGGFTFAKLNLVRVPLRLGFDVFDQGLISDIKINMLMDTMKAYKNLMNAYGVSHHIACATSAMRTASNSREIIRKVKAETGIEIDIISGDEEAVIVFESHIAEQFSSEDAYLYIDVGGGSTELSFFFDGKLQFKHSYDIGTIRLLKNIVNDEEWQLMKNDIREFTKGHKSIKAIGSGGNINKIFSLSKKKEGKPLQLDQLKDYYKELSSFTIAERMAVYKLREDRADVIVPALLIYMNAMRWSGAEEMFVPKIGVVDGLIRHLHEQILG